MIYICKPKKIKIYVNTGYKTMAQIKAETGCDAIINGGLFEGNRACRRLFADKKTIADDGVARWGLAWDENIVRCSQNWLHYYNFISCTCIVRDGKSEANLDYTKDMSGARQRTAMGVFEDDRVWLYATHTPTTPEQLQKIALDAGVKHAIMLDGGGSTQCIFPNGTLTSSRKVHNLICVWTEEEEKPEEPTKKEELKVPKKYIDISEHQGNIDWTKVKNEVDGVMIRAGYGKNNIDKKFVRNITECNRLGIPCGVYWFSYALNENMAKQEAEFCLAAIKPYKVELPVCFDFEYDSVNVAKNNGVTITKKIATSFVHAFCQTIEKAGYYAMNYTNKDYLSRYFDDTTLRYDLWLAQWPNVVDLNNPPSGAGIWQYTSKGKVNGISGNVDMDAAYKDYASAIRAAGLNGLAPAAEKPEAEAKSEPEEKTDKAKEWAISKGIVAEGEKLDVPITKAELVAALYMLNNG